MSEWRDAALDAGYRGDEADQAARMLEEQERERYEAREEDRRSTDVADPLTHPAFAMDAEGIEKLKLTEMAKAGQKLAERWGHPAWSDSWAEQVAKALYDAYRSVPDA